MVSTRLVLPTLVLLVLALVPVAVHSYLGLTHDDHVRVAALPEILDGWPSVPAPRAVDWGRNHFGSDEWVDRWYGTTRKVRLVVVRTYDPVRVYHRPEGTISPALAGTDRARPVRLANGTPAFVLRPRAAGGGLIAYALLAEGEPVANPYLRHLRLAVRMLAGAGWPMTLVYAEDQDAGDEPLEDQPPVRLLKAALGELRRSVRTTSPAEG